MLSAALRIRSSSGDGEKRKREGESGAIFSTTRADSATQAAKRCYWRERAQTTEGLGSLAKQPHKKKRAVYNTKLNANNTATV